MIYIFLIILLFPAISFGIQDSTTASPTTSGQQGTNWTNPQNVYTENDTRAINNGTNSEYMTTGTYAFDIPTDATIDSIVVFLAGYSDGSNGPRRTLNIQLIKGGTAQGDVVDLIQSSGSPDVTNEIRGAITDLWNLSFTEADIEAAGFGVQITKANSTSSAQYIDHVYIRVHYDYTEPGSSTPQIFLMGPFLR